MTLLLLVLFVMGVVLLAWINMAPALATPAARPVSRPSPGPPKPPSFIHLPGGGRYEFEVVGESRHQDALDRICGGRCEAGHRRPVVAQLVREPANPHDRKAVAVVIDGEKVGHLPRKLASDWSKIVSDNGLENARVTCDAVITGGWSRRRNDGSTDQGHYGVRLDLVDEEQD